MAPRRAAPSQPTLDILGEAQIIEVALQLVRKEGVDRLSMRALAAQLGVTPMAIYYYVPHKSALLDRIVDAVYGQIPTPPADPAQWRSQMKAFAMAAAKLVESYPGLSRVIVERPNNKAGRALARYGISLLLAAGFDVRESALALATYQTYLFGIYSAQASLRIRADTRVRADRRQKGEALGAGAQHIEAVSRQVRELRTEDLLEYGIDLVLEGIAARAKEASAERPTKSQRKRAT